VADLLPCPFCGSSNLRYEFCGSQGYIECNECGAQGPCDERAADPICSIEAAEAAWNRRAALAQSEPTGPTDEEIAQVLADLAEDIKQQNMYDQGGASWAAINAHELLERIARWGQPTSQEDY
jgi:hypothetical protein